MKEEIKGHLIDIFDRINIQTPSNFNSILEFIIKDLDGQKIIREDDVSFSFRKWIQKQ